MATTTNFPQAVIEPIMQDTLDTYISRLESQLDSVSKALAVVKQLRTPVTGCPWDLEQSHGSLRPYMLEESHEATEAMSRAEKHPEDTDAQHDLKDELGDVLLQVMLNAQIADDNGHFNFQDVCANMAEKLIRRHPHVFQPEKQQTLIDNPEAVSVQWQEIKDQEKGGIQHSSILDKVGHGTSALGRAGKVSRAAVKAGFTWPDDATLWDCVMSEFDELKAEMDSAPRDHAKLVDEMGDVFFACASLAKHIKVDPELAMSAAVHKFERRFRKMEELVRDDQKNTDDLSFDDWEAYWSKAKAELRAAGLST